MLGLVVMVAVALAKAFVEVEDGKTLEIVDLTVSAAVSVSFQERLNKSKR